MNYSKNNKKNKGKHTHKKRNQQNPYSNIPILSLGFSCIQTTSNLAASIKELETEREKFKKQHTRILEDVWIDKGQ